MDVTEDELSRALRMLYVTIREPEQPTASVVGSPEGWKPFSARGRFLHPGDVLIDLMAKVKDERERRAAEEAECRAEGARCDRKGGPCTCPCNPEAEAAAAVMSNRDDALEALRASAWQQQKWGDGSGRDELRSARLEAERAKVSALLDVADAIREQTAAHQAMVADAG